MCRLINYLARIRIDDAHVVDAIWPLQHNFLHVLPNNLEGKLVVVLIDNFHEELLDIAKQLLRNAFASRVDADFDAGGRK